MIQLAEIRRDVFERISDVNTANLAALLILHSMSSESLLFNLLARPTISRNEDGWYEVRGDPLACLYLYQRGEEVGIEDICLDGSFVMPTPEIIVRFEAYPPNMMVRSFYS